MEMSLSLGPTHSLPHREKSSQEESQGMASYTAPGTIKGPTTQVQAIEEPCVSAADHSHLTAQTREAVLQGEPELPPDWASRKHQQQ